MTNSTINHKNQLGNFNVTKKGLDRNGNRLYDFIQQTPNPIQLPKLYGFRRVQKNTVYRTQAVDLETTLKYFDGQVEAQLTYKWYDLQDESDSHTGTLEEARQWLLDFWIFNPYHEEDLEDMPDYDEDKHHNDIRQANFLELDNMMAGIDWTIELEDK